VLILILAACAPSVNVQDNVLPTLISVTVRPDASGDILLQGRYFGDGQAGKAAGSYVIVGADMNGHGGVRAKVKTWSSSRIAASIPKGAGSGYVFVSVRGVLSNGIPANLP
jgi:hypothetical protein